MEEFILKKEIIQMPEKDLKGTEISYLLNKKFEEMIIEMFTKPLRRVNKHSENFKKEIGNIRIFI